MANIVKITEVTVYTGLTEDAGDCFACKKLLDQEGVKHNLLNYGHEPEVHAANFAALSTWTFGPDFKQHTFTKFPIVTWKEFYDDYERWMEVAVSSEELKNSNVIKHKAIVQ